LVSGTPGGLALDELKRALDRPIDASLICLPQPVGLVKDGPARLNRTGLIYVFCDQIAC